MDRRISSLRCGARPIEFIGGVAPMLRLSRARLRSFVAPKWPAPTCLAFAGAGTWSLDYLFRKQVVTV